MRTIRVTGKGQIKVKPDMTHITMTLEGLFKDYGETLRHALTCQQCGKEFQSYGNKERKYCCRECYIASRRPLQSGAADYVSYLVGADR